MGISWLQARLFPRFLPSGNSLRGLRRGGLAARKLRLWGVELILFWGMGAVSASAETWIGEGVQPNLMNGGALATVGGNPAIAGTAVTGNAVELYFVRANDQGTTPPFAPPILVDPNGGANLGMILVNGNPAILSELLGRTVNYVRASDSLGQNWGAPTTIVATEGAASRRALAVVDGRPAIAYLRSSQTQSNREIRYIRSGDANGETWGASILVDSFPPSSLAVDNRPALIVLADGRPAMAYLADNSGHPKFARANDLDGVSWALPISVAGDLNEQIWSCDGALINGRPAIAYYSISDQWLKFARANDATGASWGAPVVAAADLYCGGNPWTGPFSFPFLSLAQIGGAPSIAFFACYFGDLKYVQARDPDGAGWGAPAIVDSPYFQSDSGRSPFLAQVNTGPAVTFADQNDALKYAYLSSQTPTPSPTPGAPPFNDARILQNSFPFTMALSQTVIAGIWVRNTGNTAWSAQDGYRLGVYIAQMGSADTIGEDRIDLPPDVTVPPHGIYQFAVSITAPPSITGQYKNGVMRLSMLREPAGWFGEPFEWSIRLLPQINGSADWAIYE